MTHPFAPLARTLAARAVRYLVIGVSGANLYAPRGQAVFVTSDIDLFESRTPTPSAPDCSRTGRVRRYVPGGRRP